MPYMSYARVSQEDLSALYACFMQGMEPVRNPNRPTHLNWPISMRSLMAVWNVLYFKKGEYAADPNKSASWNRGAYLVQGLGHCGECHTPRSIAGQVKAVSEKNGRQFLAGATPDNWHATPLSEDFETGLHAWSKNEIAEFLRTSRTECVAAFGTMVEVVGKSTQYLTDEDLMAIAEYLKSLPSYHYEGDVNADSALQAGAASTATRASYRRYQDAWLARLPVQLQRLPSLERVRGEPDLSEPGEKRSDIDLVAEDTNRSGEQ